MPYRLLVVKGGVEPYVLPETVPEWDGLERLITDFVRSGEYERPEDGLFFVEIDRKGRLKGVGAFTGGFMEEMLYKAHSPKAWSPRRRKG